MTNALINAAPLVRDYGTQDLSTRQVPREPDIIPQHLPHVYTFAQRGDLDRNLLVGVERERVYGTDTFDPLSKYFFHPALFANVINAQGNACVYQRVVPEDAGPTANFTLWLDVIAATVDTYERNSDGSFKKNNLGEKIKNGTTAGYKVAFVTTSIDDKEDLQAEFGLQTQGPGAQTGANNAQSTRYPILDFKVNSQGEFGNRLGVRLWAPTSLTSVLPAQILSQERAYPYVLQVVEKPENLNTPNVKPTIFNEQSVVGGFKEGVLDPLTNKQQYFGDTFVESYSNTTDARYPKVVADFNGFHIYQNNLEELLGLFHAAEAAHIDGQSDFTDAASDKHLFNFVGGTDSAGRPYHSYQFVTVAGSVSPGQYTTLYAAGGSDGTMTLAVLDALVSNEVKRYADRTDEVQDLPGNPVSILYDSGFGTDTKLDLISFITQRHDTFVVLSTQIAGERDFTASEEHSLAVTLRTRAQSYPESDYFGTGVMRAMIVGRSGLIRNSLYKKRVPLSYEIAYKAAKYMGAGNGRWKSGSDFDGAPGSVIDTIYDINITWVPETVRNRNWDVGLNWVQRYDLRSFFFPALKTVTEDDTSVLTSFINVMGICQINKIAHAAWREYTGVSKYTNAQLVDRLNNFVRERVNGIFDNRFVIIPDATITELDALRGFSWTLPIKAYLNNMKTVQTSYTQAFRMEDLLDT